MEEWNTRTKLLIGSENVEKLEKTKILIYGVGGVGSFVVEALARAGVGYLTLIDRDVISVSNINRQIHATTKSIGEKKVEAMKKRIADINPKCVVTTYMGIEIENEEDYVTEEYSYVVDAIDTISHKVAIIKKANELNVPIMSAMGAGNRLDPTKFHVEDIYKTRNCKLSKVIRKELRKASVPKLKVVYSQEDAIKNEENIIGSISFVPPVVGMIIAGEVIKDILK